MIKYISHLMCFWLSSAADVAVLEASASTAQDREYFRTMRALRPARNLLNSYRNAVRALLAD